MAVWAHDGADSKQVPASVWLSRRPCWFQGPLAARRVSDGLLPRGLAQWAGSQPCGVAKNRPQPLPSQSHIPMLSDSPDRHPSSCSRQHKAEASHTGHDLTRVSLSSRTRSARFLHWAACRRRGWKLPLVMNLVPRHCHSCYCVLCTAAPSYSITQGHWASLCLLSLMTDMQTRKKTGADGSRLISNLSQAHEYRRRQTAQCIY
jgi:hypothetical protein